MERSDTDTGAHGCGQAGHHPQCELVHGLGDVVLEFLGLDGRSSEHVGDVPRRKPIGIDTHRALRAGAHAHADVGGVAPGDVAEGCVTGLSNGLREGSLDGVEVADGVCDCPTSPVGGNEGQTVVADEVQDRGHVVTDPLATEIDAAADLVESGGDLAADAVTGFEYEHRAAVRLEVGGGREPGEAGTDHDHVVHVRSWPRQVRTPRRRVRRSGVCRL